MQFQFRHVGRPTYPQKHILIVEDTITHQIDILKHFGSIFDHQGIVQLSVVPGSLAAAGIISSVKIDVIILDHDLPEGNGSDLMEWLKETGRSIPVITFSGIPMNNARMMSLGATHNFIKHDVIGGKADDIIKTILGLNEVKVNSGIAEWYQNTYSPQPAPMPRYWITPKILVGGNVVDAMDYQHLEKDFGIKAVVNVDERSESSFGIANLLEAYVEDEGVGFPAEYVRKVVSFGKEHMNEPMYVHCHIGASRSPHFVYAILRGAHGLSRDDAMATVLKALPNERYRWGFNQHTASYVASIEAALNGWTP